MRISDWSSDVCSSDLLPRARPAFQRLLAADGRLDAVKHIEIDEGLHAVPLREAVDEPLAMLIDAAWQVVCHADVERAIGPAGKTIDVVRHAPQLAPLRPSGSSLPKHSDVAQIGRAHVRTPVTNAHLVCRLLLEKKNNRSHNNKHKVSH